jgi:hypothetical protein
MHEVNVLLAENPDFKFVQVTFDENNFPGTLKKYTYKTLEKVEIGDKVLVDSPSSGFTVTTVSDVLSPMEIDFEVKYKYKWIVQVIDTVNYDQMVAVEKDLLALVNKSKNKRAIAIARQAILDEHGDDSTELLKLVRNI